MFTSLFSKATSGLHSEGFMNPISSHVTHTARQTELKMHALKLLLYKTAKDNETP